MTQMVDSTETKTKLKKSVNYAFLPFSVPLLLLSSAAKVGGTTNDNLALPSGKVRAATLSFHSFCPGAPLSVPVRCQRAPASMRSVAQILRSCRGG